MNGRNSYLVVGMFVTAGIVLLVTLSLMLAGGSSTEPTERYTVLFHRDISGLTLGAPVRYLGVGVGEVVDMKLVTDDGSSVRVDLEVLQSTPINSSTYASLAFQGVTGVAFISLAADEDNQAMALGAGEFEYPVIPTREVGLAALLSDGPEITHKISLLLDRVNRLLDEDNQSALSRSLANIEDLTESLADQDKTIAALPGQLRSMLEQVENAFGTLQSTLDQAEPDLLATMATLNETSSNLAKISGRLDKWVTDHDRDMDQFVRDGLAQTPALIADSRNTIRELEKLLAELRHDPSQIVFRPNSEPVVVEP